MKKEEQLELVRKDLAYLKFLRDQYVRRNVLVHLFLWPYFGWVMYTGWGHRFLTFLNVLLLFLAANSAWRAFKFARYMKGEENKLRQLEAHVRANREV